MHKEESFNGFLPEEGGVYGILGDKNHIVAIFNIPVSKAQVMEDSLEKA